MFFHLLINVLSFMVYSVLAIAHDLVSRPTPASQAYVERIYDDVR